MKRLLALASALVLLFALTPTALAGTQGGCSTPGTSGLSVRFWENSINDFSDGNDTWWSVCNHTAPYSNRNLHLIDHTLPGECNDGVPFNQWEWWDNCISSVTVWGMGSSLWRLCWWTDKDFSGSLSWLTGPYPNGTRRDLPYFNDQTTSWIMNNDGTCNHP